MSTQPLSTAVPDQRRAGYDADVIVVGAGPAGTTTAYHLARQGLDVLVLEKTSFPREKVCGDGLTPRAVKALVSMGIDTSPANGWARNSGLRIIGGGMSLLMPWPDLSTFPDYGLTRTRKDFDELLATQAKAAGARLLENTTVSGPVRHERTGRIEGVVAQTKAADGAKGPELTYRAPLVVAADGNSSRLGVASGRVRREDRPMGVAVRTYFNSPFSDDEWLESHLELWDGDRLLPGYGWVFGLGDGRVNVGLGILDSSPAFGKVDYKALLSRWLERLGEEYEFTEPTEPIRGAALPMAFNRKPHYADGLLLVGDSAGMVNPFNGEGIAYAMESAEIAADVMSQALRRPTPYAREKALADYPRRLKAEYGGYYTLGRLFVKLIGHPEIMRLCAQRGLSHPLLMKVTMTMLSNLRDPRAGEPVDRLVNTLARVMPSS
ncbi:MAG: geranylgeranyl reductase family protein [Candidatus Nanopelagicales bacterium]